MLTLFLIAIVLLVTLFLVLNYWRHKDFWDKFEKIKGDKTLPLVGNGLKYLGKNVPMLELMELHHNKYGKSTFRVQIGRACYVVLSEPETCEVLLGNTKELFKRGDYMFLYDWLGDGLFLSNGNYGKLIRKTITPMLHFKTMESFTSVFNAKEDVLLKILKEKVGKVLEVQHLMSAYFLDVMCETVMGTAINALEDPANSDFFCAAHSETKLFKYRVSCFWKKMDFLYRFTDEYKQHVKNIRILNGFTDRIIADGRKNFVEKHESLECVQDLSNDDIKKNKTFTLLDMLFTIKHPDGSPLSDTRIRMEVNSLLFGGHETTMTTFSFTIYMLAHNPEVQKRAFQEQMELLGDNLSVSPTFEDVEKMKYLDRVIRETLRIYPPAPVFSRILQKDMTLPDGLIIPGGCRVVVSPYLMARNPAYYPDPLKFDPDRFLPENSQNKHPYSYLAFSAGIRNCVGQRFAMVAVKSVLSKVLRHFEVLPGGPGTELYLSMEVLLRSKNGINVIVKEREYPL